MTINTTLIICMVAIFYFIVPFLILLIKNEKTQKILTTTFFSLFIAILIVGTLGKIDISKNTTITFETAGNWFDKKINLSFLNLTKQDILINIFMLIPVGFFTCFCFKKSQPLKQLLFSLIFGLCFGFLIEFCQFMFPVPRSVQLSDIIFNMISSTIGASLYMIYKAIANKIHKKND